MNSLGIYKMMLDFSYTTPYKLIDIFIGFEACCLCIALFITYYAKIRIDNEVNRITTNKNLVEKIVIFSIIDLLAAVIISFGIWKNRWFIDKLGWVSFDTMFNIIAIMLSVISVYVLVLTYYKYTFEATWALFLSLIPIVSLSTIGYASMIRKWAETN